MPATSVLVPTLRSELGLCGSLSLSVSFSLDLDIVVNASRGLGKLKMESEILTLTLFDLDFICTFGDSHVMWNTGLYLFKFYLSDMTVCVRRRFVS